MTIAHHSQSLENRRLLSAALPTAPPQHSLISESVSEYASLSQKVRIGYLPELSVEHLSQLQGNVEWGDNTTSQASFERDKKGGIDVVATHTYVKPGTFSVGAFLTLSPPVDPGHPVPQYIMVLGLVTTTATVINAPPQITEQVGKSFTAELGDFPHFALNGFLTAEIKWGDGHVTSNGTISPGHLPYASWQVTGSHTYNYTGLYLAHAYVYSHVFGSKQPAALVEEFDVLVHVTKDPAL